MKKINSINYGYKIVFAVILFLVILPVMFYLLSMLISAEWLSSLIKTSMVIGSAILLFFILLLIIELHQDKRINRYYEKHRNRKLQITNTAYECQACGNRKLRAGDKSCPVCGSRFQE